MDAIVSELSVRHLEENGCDWDWTDAVSEGCSGGSEGPIEDRNSDTSPFFRVLRGEKLSSIEEASSVLLLLVSDSP